MVSSSNDFAAEVLAKLINRHVTFRGCHPEALDISSDGGCKVWFSRMMPGGRMRRCGLSMVSEPEINSAVYMGRPEVIAYLCEKLIDHTHSRYC